MRFISSSVFSVLSFVVLFVVPAFAIGPVQIDELSPESKVLWDNTVVVTAVVKEIAKEEKTWRVVSLAPISVLNGELDPGKKALIRIGYADSGFLAIPHIQEGDRVIAICRRRGAGEIPEFEWAKDCNPGDHALRVGFVGAGDVVICGFCVLSRPGEISDLEKAALRVEGLVEKIREIRTQPK
ncbi:hypothetical protein [Anatilimnocola floriformis]|uniref:hypothetical protein n=1 Tax=Anatilimnocola floriformis TaxID=2948575 RepID=UPI0020C24DF0|nr:hypothetical protein [Anatilimnocola floriformis]